MIMYAFYEFEDRFDEEEMDEFEEKMRLF